MSIEPCRTGNRVGRVWSRLVREQDGATAVEFALVAFPFLLALLATLEIALVLWSGEVLEKAVATASRKIYTGEFQTDSSNANKSATFLKGEIGKVICAEVSPIIKCEDVSVDVRAFSTFAGASPPSPVTSSRTYDASAFTYATVAAKQIGIVTAAVEYKTVFPSVRGTLLANGNRVLIATAAFRTEPYSN